MRYLALVVVIFILSVFGIAMLVMPDQIQPTPQNRAYGEALIGGSFEAVNHLGEPISDQDLLGHYSVVYFGFTHCPDICPTGLLTLANALDSLPPELAEQVMPVFVTVDPDRDTPEAMKSYVSNFYPRLVGVTGSKEQIDTIAKAYKVYYKIVPQEDSASEYLVDHSGYFYLMGTDGKYLTHFPHNASEQSLAEGLRGAIADSSRF